MKRRVWLALLAGGVVVGVAAQARALGPPDFDNQYEGRAESDRATYVGFDVVRQGDVRKVKHIRTFLTYHCSGGEGGWVTAEPQGSLRVRKDKTFSGTLLVDNAPTRGSGSSQDFKLKFAGKLRKHGKAKGTVEGKLRISDARARGGSTPCSSGGLDWKAKRGADVEPSF